MRVGLESVCVGGGGGLSSCADGRGGSSWQKQLGLRLTSVAQRLMAFDVVLFVLAALPDTQPLLCVNLYLFYFVQGPPRVHSRPWCAAGDAVTC